MPRLRKPIAAAAVPVVAVSLALWSATACAMHAADIAALYRWCSTRFLLQPAKSCHDAARSERRSIFSRGEMTEARRRTGGGRGRAKKRGGSRGAGPKGKHSRLRSDELPGAARSPRYPRCGLASTCRTRLARRRSLSFELTARKSDSRAGHLSTDASHLQCPRMSARAAFLLDAQLPVRSN
jgi:hypothetical protein